MITAPSFWRSSAPHQRDPDAGFTLIEVLVALTIFSFSLVVLLGVFSQSLARAHDAERAMAARVFAQSLLARAETDPAPKFGTASGQSDNGLSWTIAISPYPQPDDDHATLHAANLSVTVRWQNRTHALTLHTLRLVPKAKT